MKNKMTEENLKIAILKSLSIAEVLRNLGMSITTGNYKSFRKNVKKYNIDTSHFLGNAHLKGKNHITKKHKDLSEILIINSDYTNMSNLKKKLVNNKIIEYKCHECNINTWNDKSLSLQLDHINGISNDNRIENIRLLCPNCHSQTDTFAGRNIGKNISVKQLEIENISTKNSICDCGGKKDSRASLCRNCENKRKLGISTAIKITWPENDILIKMLSSLNFNQIGKLLGVSDRVVRNYMQNRNLLKNIVGCVGNDPTT